VEFYAKLFTTMKATGFTARRTGQLIRVDSGNWAFEPNTLPPSFDLPLDTIKLISEADAELGRLAGIADQMKNPASLFMNFLRREAVLSSKIEGTHSTITDLALYSAVKSRGQKRDTREVANYVRALHYGIDRCTEIPLGRTLLGELHRMLFDGTNKPENTPGRIREHQVVVGSDNSYATARYVPPPHMAIPSLMENLEDFLQEQTLPVLVRTAVAHYQFEAIHPFVDGNGRLGRLLILAMLRAENRLRHPMLYLSAYFERNKLAYYDRLLAISQDGQWDEWFKFFLIGVKEQAMDAAIRADRLNKLRQSYRDLFSTARTSGTMGKLIDWLFEIPIVSVPRAAELMEISYKPAKESIKKLVDKGVLVKVEDDERPILYMASGIIDVLEQEIDERTEPGHK
jgi:Fic family protein